MLQLVREQEDLGHEELVLSQKEHGVFDMVLVLAIHSV